jgi:hypothetical protein
VVCVKCVIMKPRRKEEAQALRGCRAIERERERERENILRPAGIPSRTDPANGRGNQLLCLSILIMPHLSSPNPYILTTCTALVFPTLCWPFSDVERSYKGMQVTIQIPEICALLGFCEA